MASGSRTCIRNRDFVRGFLDNSVCADCGESNLVFLEFDHVRGEKRTPVSRYMQGGYSLRVLWDEVSKCDVVCANCHRARTYGRLGSCYKV